MIQLLLNKTTPHFQILPMPKLTNPNYAFMRRRLYIYRKRKVKEYKLRGYALNENAPQETHAPTTQIIKLKGVN